MSRKGVPFVNQPTGDQTQNDPSNYADPVDSRGSCVLLLSTPGNSCQASADEDRYEELQGHDRCGYDKHLRRDRRES